MKCMRTSAKIILFVFLAKSWDEFKLKFDFLWKQELKVVDASTITVLNKQLLKW